MVTREHPRVAVVHSFYRSENPSGENRVVEAETAALERAGWDVHLLDFRTDDLRDEPLYEIRAMARVATGRGRSPLEDIARIGPDVVHVHNLFPNVGRHWVLRAGVPIVHTVHNLRHLCANGLCFRDGHDCTDCIDGGSTWPAVRHGCYTGSRIASIPGALAASHPARNPLLRTAHLIFLSDEQRALFERAGVDVAGSRVWPNFLPQPHDPGPSTSQRDGWVVVARLSPEKGVLQLLAEWPSDETLTVIGDGPLRGEVTATAGPNVRLLGPQDRDRVLAELGRAEGMIVPSVVREGFPLVYCEALAAGCQVLAHETNGVAALVRRDRTGAVLQWGTDVSEQLRRARASAPSPLAVRAVFDEHYSEAAFVGRASDLYRRVVAPDVTRARRSDR